MQKTYLSAALLLVALILPVGDTGASATEPVQDVEVRGVVDRYAEAWNQHDTDALGALFAPDADFVNVTGQRWKGRHEIQANLAFLHATVPEGSSHVGLPANTYGALKAVTYRFESFDVRFIRNDIAIAHVTWTQFGDPRFTEPRHGIFSFAVVHERGHWLLDAAQNTVLAVPLPIKKSG